MLQFSFEFERDFCVFEHEFHCWEEAVGKEFGFGADYDLADDGAVGKEEVILVFGRKHLVPKFPNSRTIPRLPNNPSTMDESPEADVGVIGLTNRGRNLALSINDRGYRACLYDRTISKVEEFLSDAKRDSLIGAHSEQNFINMLKLPRRVFLAVKDGVAVDAFIDKLAPYLEKNDIIIDFSNAGIADTERRVEKLRNLGLLFISCGLSEGGNGLSIMPSGNIEAWVAVKGVLQDISAHVNGLPCCEWIGENSAGNYVRTVLNAVEHTDMQLISEVYSVLKDVCKMDNAEIAEVIQSWNEGESRSYLTEISVAILKFRVSYGCSSGIPESTPSQDTDNTSLLAKIRDVTKTDTNTKSTALSALEHGQPASLLHESVFSSYLSTLKDDRIKNSKTLKGNNITRIPGGSFKFIEKVRQAFYALKTIAYAQIFMLLRQSFEKYDYPFKGENIARIWNGGTVVQCELLSKIEEVFSGEPDLRNILLSGHFKSVIHKFQNGWRDVICAAVTSSVPIPCISSGLAFFDAYRSEFMTANLIQAQRDAFGAHTYELLSDPGKFMHTNWTGRGGNVTAQTYDVK